SIERFGRQLVGHGLFIARAGGRNQPADRKRLAAVGTNLDRNLIGGTTDAARAHFDGRRNIVERAAEHFDRVLLGFRLDLIERAIHDGFGDGLLTVFHDAVHELGENGVTIFGVRDDLPALGTMAARHIEISLLRTLHAVLRTALFTVLDALRVEHAAQDVITDAGKVLHAAAADHDDRVLLKVMTFTRNIADDLEAVGETHLCDLTQSRVRLLRCRGVYTRTYATLLRARLKMARLLAVDGRSPRLADQLADSRHCSPFPQSARQWRCKHVN